LTTRVVRLFRLHSRTGASIAFGLTTALVAYFAWIPSARISIGVIYLTVAAGLAHAVGGAIVGPSLVDPARTPSEKYAALRGARASLIALALFSIAFSGYLLLTDGWTLTLASVFYLPIYTAFFAFLSLGWALLMISALVGWGIHSLVN
jgi:hypothetical protein